MVIFLVFVILLQIYLSRHLILENIALRHQLLVYKRTIQKPVIKAPDRLLWAILSRIFPDWKNSLAIVQPSTVLSWHRNAARIFWRWISRSKGSGRPETDEEIQNLIRQMSRENPSWGPERITGELLKLGHRIHLNTVRKFMPKKISRKPPGGTWKTFIDLHMDVTAAMDFFTVFSWNFVPMYVFFVIHHGTREILHVNVTTQPNMKWIRQQLKEAFDFNAPDMKYLIFDNDPVFRYSMDFMKEILTLTPVKTSLRSPWQNGYAERFVRTIREDLTDHIIPLSEKHLRRLVNEYVK